MVTNVTSLTGNGLKDWLIQRVSAIYLAVYAVFLFGFILLHPHMSFETWAALFHCTVVQIASLLALFFILLHAWVGLWTVTTDYLSCTVLRLCVQVTVLAWLLGQFVWGVMILWGR